MTTQSLPSTLNAIRAIAAPMFADSAVHSVNVQATFGIVTVFRDGQCYMAGEGRAA